MNTSRKVTILNPCEIPVRKFAVNLTWERRLKAFPMLSPWKEKSPPEAMVDSCDHSIMFHSPPDKRHWQRQETCVKPSSSQGDQRINRKSGVMC